MKLGEIAKLTIPEDLGYGAAGFPAWGYPLSIVWCMYCVCIESHMYMYTV